MQWHVTERCNLRCSHCYQESYGGEELDFDGLIRILDQYRGLLGRWRRGGQRVRGHVTVTGGEPFVREDFVELLELLASHRREFSFAILTNGSKIDRAMASRLGRLGPTFVQVSIEGARATHDDIRGAGDFDRTVEALRLLVKQRLRTMISFSAHQGNYREFPEVVSLAHKLRVARVWSDRVLPMGSGAALGPQLLTPEQTREFFEIMCDARDRLRRKWFTRTEVAMHRALQFLVGDSHVYHCTAGDSLITVQPNGDLYPCRRMPVKVGNLTETPLEALYHGSELFEQLRDRGRISEGCEGCDALSACRGGLKCLSLAVTGSPFKADPGCWKASHFQFGPAR